MTLQRHTIDAQENPLSLISNASFYEVQKYVNLTSYVGSGIYVVIGHNKLHSMPKDLQSIAVEAAKKMSKYEYSICSVDAATLKISLEKYGMIFV